MKRVVIDCERNDWEDIKCGGPQFLGFDFKVDDSEDDKDLEEWLRKTLKTYGHKIYSIRIYKIDEEVWTREKMEECIKFAKF